MDTALYNIHNVHCRYNTMSKPNVYSIFGIYAVVIMRPIKVSMFELQKVLAPRARQPQLAVPGQGGRGQGSQQPEKEGEINEKQTGKSCEGGNKS